jgi:hypothetical protein
MEKPGEALAQPGRLVRGHGRHLFGDMTDTFIQILRLLFLKPKPALRRVDFEAIPCSCTLPSSSG